MPAAIRQQPNLSIPTLRARFDLNESDRRSKLLYIEHNLIDPRFTPVGLCSKAFGIRFENGAVFRAIFIWPRGRCSPLPNGGHSPISCLGKT
jgi:hypothetical protein